MIEPEIDYDDPATAAAVEGAQAWLARFAEAWNAADVELIRDELHYPHITIGRASDATVATTRDEFDPRLDELRAKEGWASSSFEGFTPIAASPTKVHFETLIQRFHTDGTLYGSARILYIVTEQDGHWGMQLRSGIRGFA